MDSQLKRGLLDISVLAALLKGDSYGYNIIKDLSPHMTMSESTLYPILRRLESAGALTVYSAEFGGRLRKYYSITPVGREKLAAFMEEWKSIMGIYDFIEREVAGSENG